VEERTGTVPTVVPRLFLVAPGVPAPVTGDLEDWVRLPARGGDVEARLAMLAVRADRCDPPPAVDDDGILRFGSRWTALSPAEAALARLLVARFGGVVTHADLVRTRRDGVISRRTLRVHILRLRVRLKPLGLAVRAIRSRGYLLEAAAGRPDGPADPIGVDVSRSAVAAGEPVQPLRGDR
jgi:Transcriptional regulatory protein, C terminal